jgi:uncharacterized protein YbjT (DUF2867 family)
MSTNPPVVVTGATGLVAKHIVCELVHRGQRVHATLRTIAKADDVRRAV